MIGMDIIGPLSRTAAGNRYALVAVDYLTRWPEVIPMPNQEAVTVVKAWIKGIISRWSVPEIVLTDQGSNFTSEICRLTYCYLGARHWTTTAYHPPTNGLVERFNRTLKTTLAKICMEYEGDWDEHLDWAVASYRFTPNEVLGMSPYEAMMGQPPTLPLSWRVGNADAAAEAIDPILDRDAFVQNMNEVADIAKRSIESNQAKAKIAYDKRARDRNFEPGDLVKLRERALKPGHKLKPTYTGPYRVIQQDPARPNTVTIQMNHGKIRTVNIQHVEPYHARDRFSLKNTAAKPVTPRRQD